MNRWISVRSKAYQVRRDIEAKIGRELYGEDLLNQIIANEQILLNRVPEKDPSLYGCQATYRPYDLGYTTITVNQDAPPSKYLFYISHELGHHFLHTRRDECNETDIDPDETILTVPYAEGRVATYNPYQLQEHEANIFAAELLIPSQRLSEKFDAGIGVTKLTDYFGVSKYSILAQLLNAVLEPPIDFEQYATQDETSFHWQDLDSSQQQAACATHGPICVDAGPGTGKTRTLTSRIEWLIENNTPPEKIVALTFSNKATDEVRQRLRTILPQKVHQITISTFHGFGVEFLRRYGSLINIEQDFVILDPIDAERLLIEHLDQLRLKHFADPMNPDKYLAKSLLSESILGFISRVKQELITPELYNAYIDEIAYKLDDEDVEKYREIGYVYEQYERLKREANVVDYDDLVMLPVLILGDHPEKVEELQALYQHILIDEFQDINRANGELVHLLAGDGQRLWVVGDLRQSIYRWRGASPGYLRDFQQYYPRATTHSLKKNYRATPHLVDYINACNTNLQLSRNANEWQADRNNGAGTEIRHVTAIKKIAERSGIIKTIRDLREQHDYDYSDFAVLCRKKKLAKEFAEALQLADIPVLHFGNYYERSEVKDLLAVVDLVANVQMVSWIRVAQNLVDPISRQQAIGLWQEVHSDELSFTDTLNLIANSSELRTEQSKEIRNLVEILSNYQYDSLANPWLIIAEFLFTHGSYLRQLRSDLERNMPRLLAIGHLMHLARSYSQRKPLANEQSRANAFLNHVRSLVERDDGEVPVPSVTDGIDAVTVLTIHKAKGLEFPVVFVPRIDINTFTSKGRSREILPYPAGLLKDSEVNAKDLEEKSGLFVAISRARDYLIVSYPCKQDNGNNRKPSQYWKHLEHPSAVELVWDDTGNTSPTPLEWVEKVATNDSDEFSATAMRRLRYCPRQFFYQDVLKLDAAQNRDIYLNFYSAISKTIEWIQEKVAEGQIVAQHDALHEFKVQFRERMPDEHVHRKWYEIQGRRLIASFLEAVQTRAQHGEVDYGLLRAGSIEGINFSITVDEILITQSAHVMFYYRIGRAKRGNLRMHLYRQTLQLSGDVPLKFMTHSLFDNQVNESTESHEQSQAKELRKNAKRVRKSEYPPDPLGQWVCATCPFFFICPL